MRLRSHGSSSETARNASSPTPVPLPPSRRAAKKSKTAAAEINDDNATVACTIAESGQPATAATIPGSPELESARTPVDSLSSEILRHILRIHASVKQPGRDGWGRDQIVHLGWIKFSHVCRRWRQAALDCPSLWADIDFTLGAKWAEAMLSRSEPSLLRLKMNHAPLSISFEDFLVTHISRTEALHTPATRPNKTGPHSQWMSLPAPHLKSLVFEPTLYAKHRLSVSKHLPDHPFADNAPNLRSITVCGYNNFFWGSSVLRNVSTVIIGRFDDRQIHKTEGYERPSYDRLLSALESMPQLETLHLNFCLPCGPSYGATRRLGMPSLKTLVLQDATTECLAFFRSLRVLNARVTLLLSEPREDRQLPKDIGSRTESAIHDHIPTPLLFTIDVIQLVARSSNWIYPSTSLLAGTDPRHFPGAPDMSKSRTIFSENTTALPLHLSMPNFANKDTMARTLLSMLLFVQIRVLSIDLLVRWDFKTWHHVVELFPHVEELWFSELIAVSFLEDCEASDVRSWSRLQTIRLGPFTEYFGATRGARRSLNKTLKRWHRRRRELGMEHLTISFYGMDDDDDESESDFSDSGDSGDSGDSLDDGDLYMGFAV